VQMAETEPRFPRRTRIRPTLNATERVCRRSPPGLGAPTALPTDHKEAIRLAARCAGLVLTRFMRVRA
jgi:hypothetical protein